MQEAKELNKEQNEKNQNSGDIKITEETQDTINDTDSDNGSSAKEKIKDKKIKKKNDKEKELLTQEIDKLNKEKQELIDKVKYTQAELINYRQRKDEETQNLLNYCNQDLISDILPIVDNLERAIALDDNDLTDELSKFLVGFKMIYSQLVEVLKQYGVSIISRAGEIFDSNLEEALMTDKVEDKKDEEVLEVLLKGYKLKDRVIRPATVKVNKLDD